MVARPLLRAIQHHLQVKLASMLLEGKFKEGIPSWWKRGGSILTFKAKEGEVE